MAYKIILSTKSEFQIDKDELQVVIDGMQSGSKFIKVKSGIFNPSYLASIEIDTKRIEGEKYLRELPDLFEKVSRIPTEEEFKKTLRLETADENSEEMRLRRADLVDKYKPDFLK